MVDQPKTPLNADQSCSNFHRILSFHHRMKLHWSAKLKGDIKNFSFGVCRWSAPPQRGDVKYDSRDYDIFDIPPLRGSRPATHPETEIFNIALKLFRPMQFHSMVKTKYSVKI